MSAHRISHNHSFGFSQESTCICLYADDFLVLISAPSLSRQGFRSSTSCSIIDGSQEPPVGQVTFTVYICVFVSLGRGFLLFQLPLLRSI